jgi:hypothetical protein
MTGFGPFFRARGGGGDLSRETDRNRDPRLGKRGGRGGLRPLRDCQAPPVV